MFAFCYNAVLVLAHNASLMTAIIYQLYKYSEKSKLSMRANVSQIKEQLEFHVKSEHDLNNPTFTKLAVQEWNSQSTKRRKVVV